MNGIQALSSQPWVARVGWTLLHFLWQGTAIAVIHVIVRFCFARTLSPPARYALASTALLAMAIAPPLTYITISNGAIAPSEFATLSLSLSAWTGLPAAIVTFWVFGVFVFSLRLFRAFRFTRRLRATSQPAPAEWQQTLKQVAARIGQPLLSGGRSPRLVVSPLVNVPAIIGWMQPLILVPASALTGLPTEHILALLAHEMAHIRRNDYLAGILQSLAEVTLFYHPAVWWISGQIRTERELCCDDLVISAGTDVLTYARALTELEARRPALLNLQLAADGGSLAERIRRLLDPAHIGTHCLPRAGSAFAMIFLWFVGTGVLAFAGAQKPTPASSLATSSQARPLVATTAGTPPVQIPVPSPISTFASHARETLLFDPVLTAQLALPKAPTPAASATVDPIADLTMAVEVNSFRLNNAESFTPIALAISGDVLVQARKAGAERTQIEITGEITDDQGVTVQNISDQMDIGTMHQTTAELASRAIEFRTAIPKLLPGSYSLKLMAHNSTTNRSGTWTSRFSVPNLNKEDQRVPITSVVLGTEQVMSYSGTNPYRQQPNPLIHDDQEIVPSVTRVFNSQNDMTVYLQAYEKGATATQPLVAYVTFLKDSMIALETSHVTVTEGLDPKSKMLPIRMNIPLGQLKSGKYICQVTVLDPATQKTASWQAPVTMTP